MSRLYEAKADENRWKIVKIDSNDYDSYKLIDKKELDIYFLNHIIGFEQVADDEFLVYKRESYDYFEIVRYQLKDSKFYKLFSKEFSRFHFINDDRIMFVNWGHTGPYHCSGIYSIKENKIIEEAKWLDGAEIGIYIDDDNNNDIRLYVEEELSSYRLDNPKLIFTVDPNTLQPNSECYSQLRDSYIKVNSKEDIERIKKEDKQSIMIISDFLFQMEREQLQIAKAKILKKDNN